MILLPRFVGRLSSKNRSQAIPHFHRGQLDGLPKTASTRSSTEKDDQKNENTGSILEGKGAIRFNLKNTRRYDDDLRNIDSPIEWTQCWYQSETLQAFRLEAEQEIQHQNLEQ